jgi:dTMP kinase
MHHLDKGILIAVEGIDGSGKSTLVNNLAQSLHTLHFPVIVTKEPGGTPLGKQLRTLLQERTAPIAPQAEFLLFAADRAQHFAHVIIPALEQKKLIISDRMADSSLVYQGYGRGLDIGIMRTINDWAMQGMRPDLTIYVRITPEIAYQRLIARKQALTAFEQEKREFFEKLVVGFDTLYKDRDDVVVLDGNLGPSELANQTLKAITQWLGKA